MQTGLRYLSHPALIAKHDTGHVIKCLSDGLYLHRMVSTIQRFRWKTYFKSKSYFIKVNCLFSTILQPTHNKTGDCGAVIQNNLNNFYSSSDNPPVEESELIPSIGNRVRNGKKL